RVPIMFVKSSQRWTHIKEIADFLGLSESTLTSFALREFHYQRSTADVAADLQAPLNRIFAPVYQLQEALGDIRTFYPNSTDAEQVLTQQLARCKTSSTSGIPVCDT